MLGQFDDHGIRFDYPPDWDIDVEQDEARVTISLQDPRGPAFAMIVVDSGKPAPSEMLDEALAAMREEFPNQDARSAAEILDGQEAIGHDIEFFSLDLIGTCELRAVQTKRHTLLVMNQWSENVDGEEHADLFRKLRGSLRATDFLD